MKEDLARFSVAIQKDLLDELDMLVKRRGRGANRSEVIRDLVREAVEREILDSPEASVIGTLTIMYNHHANDLTERLHDVQHDYCPNIVSTTHVHVDAHTCLEVIILRGKNETVQMIANRILGTKGVRHGKLVVTSVEE